MIPDTTYITGLAGPLLSTIVEPTPQVLHLPELVEDDTWDSMAAEKIQLHLVSAALSKVVDPELDPLLLRPEDFGHYPRELEASYHCRPCFFSIALSHPASPSDLPVMNVFV
jgi:hypothetical protein